jgi:hypothetical protein
MYAPPVSDVEARVCSVGLADQLVAQYAQRIVVLNDLLDVVRADACPEIADAVERRYRAQGWVAGDEENDFSPLDRGECARRVAESGRRLMGEHRLFREVGLLLEILHLLDHPRVFTVDVLAGRIVAIRGVLRHLTGDAGLASRDRSAHLRLRRHAADLCDCRMQHRFVRGHRQK